MNNIVNLLQPPSISGIKNRFQLLKAYLKHDPEPKGMPTLIHVEVTNRCNLRCKMCGRTVNELKGNSDLSLTQFKNIVDQSTKYGAEMIILHSWGEPLLNHSIYDMISYASYKGMPTWMSTNATLLDINNSKKIIDSGLGGIVFSIDGSTAETYETIRCGANFNDVVNNIRQFLNLKLETKSKMMCTVQMIEMPENQHEVKDFKAMWESYDVNVLIKPQVNWENTLPNSKNKSKEFICDKLWFWMKIHSDGKVYPCGHDFQKKYCLGDTNKEKLLDIWRGDKFVKFREQMKSGNIDICSVCSYRPPRRRNIVNNIGFVMLDVYTITRLIFTFGYKK
ncbi:MAG: SPASM domain-containing protein [Deltaproteobacteria bacterium]|nr:SPASM domain-containing protein [Deltaproteobacteria bacterium]